jgi:hypothetical protein
MARCLEHVFVGSNTQGRLCIELQRREVGKVGINAVATLPQWCAGRLSIQSAGRVGDGQGAFERYQVARRLEVVLIFRERIDADIIGSSNVDKLLFFEDDGTNVLPHLGDVGRCIDSIEHKDWIT